MPPLDVHLQGAALLAGQRAVGAPEGALLAVHLQLVLPHAGRRLEGLAAARAEVAPRRGVHLQEVAPSVTGRLEGHRAAVAGVGPLLAVHQLVLPQRVPRFEGTRTGRAVVPPSVAVRHRQVLPQLAGPAEAVAASRTAVPVAALAAVNRLVPFERGRRLEGAPADGALEGAGGEVRHLVLLEVAPVLEVLAALGAAVPADVAVHRLLVLAQRVGRLEGLRAGGAGEGALLAVIRQEVALQP